MRTRATSTTLSYVLTLAIATLLVAGLILAGGTFVEEHREQVVRQELRVVGEHLASNVEQVDRYAGSSSNLDTARVEQTLPPSVTGSAYTVSLTDSDELHLNATRPDISVVVDLTVAHGEVTTTTEANGGRIAAFCDGSSPCNLRIENA